MSPEVISMREPDEPTTSERILLSSGRYVTFGPFRVDQQRQEVSRNGARLKLQGKVYQVLITLLEKPGEVVTREELRMRLGPADTHVNYDANVNTTVNKLRQALGESTEKPLYIETIPRKGYSFISTAEFSDVPFPVTAGESPGSEAVNSGGPGEPSEAGVPRSRRWLTIIIVALILGGMLLGAG